MRIARLAGLLAITLISSGLIPLPARAAIAAVPFDFDGNGYADLATGVPGESVGSVKQAGAVEVIYASADGLTATGRNSGPGPALASTANPPRASNWAGP